MSTVNNSVYVDGKRVAVPPSLDQTYETMDETNGMGWIGLYRPTREEIDSVAEEFHVHHLVVEDSIKAHQRPKLERYGDVLFTVLRTARYVDAAEHVEFGELHVITGTNFVVTSRFAETPDLSEVRRRLEDAPELLAFGPESVLYAVLDQVVDEYEPVVWGLSNDIDEIELQVFEGDPGASRRIYGLLREVIEFQRATQPIPLMLEQLKGGFEKYNIDEELRRRLRDVEDHAIKVIERIDAFRALLEGILTVNATLVAQRQNEEIQRLNQAQFAQNEDVKKVSSWAAIFFAPTLVAGIYGMNFEYMPEFAWKFGYPFSILLMFGGSAVLYFLFKKRGWL